ncbi:dynein axonemal assembly factor 11-like [Littorina saxatilis]|uniref:Leucine-rich repeat-containing protein 51 n=1 Tax=Littorina saxatilis TaxID=31220 RepID=A0AAN9G2X8_9CAEN
MSEPDRISQLSGLVQTSDSTGGSSDMTGSSLAVIQFKPPPEPTRQITASSAQLPSRKFQFSVWHDLRSTNVHGPQLKAPRVRRGPAEKEKAFYLMVDEQNNKIHHDLQGRQRNTHRDTLEDWETAQLANFPCQDLQHRYQTTNSDRILDRLRLAAFVNLRDNALLDLSSYNFSNCEYLNLDDNYLTSFKKLPTLKKVRHLTMKDNDIASFTGLDRLRNWPLEELFLIGNPISFQMGYRQKVFAVLPGLKFLDGVAKQEEDMEELPPDRQQSSCVVS